MDWSKSKSIFIVVFLILDVFLYSLYLNRHTEAQKMETTLLGEDQNFEVWLKNDNISYEHLPINIEKAPYISGTVKNFAEAEIDLPNEQTVVIENKNKLLVTLEKPVAVNIEDPSSLNDFVKSNVYEGASYTLWEVDAEKKQATFYQTINKNIIYHNINSLVIVYWNDDEEIIKYQQTFLEDITAKEEQEVLTPPLRTIQTLYNKGLLQSNSTIQEMNLGYSTLVQGTKNQVFVPTWEIRVKTANDTEEEYFVNAVEGGVIDVKLNASEIQEVEELVEEAITEEDE
ncbi:two-component system regulatory protein YycI [Lysinibacillus yapensis]|nr:two-component system regulatory protein YycI [Lysinibacillus yapensis]